MMGKSAKALLFFVLISVTLLAIAAGVTQTSFFRHWLKGQLVQAVNARIDGQLSVGALEGNLFGRLELREVKVERQSETIAEVARVSVFHQLAALLQKRILLSEVTLDSLYFNLKQDESSVWNASRLLPAADSNAAEPDAVTRFDWDIDIPVLEVLNGRVEVFQSRPGQTKIPRQVKDLDFVAGFWMTGPEVKVRLESLSFETLEPAFKVQTAARVLSYGPDSLAVRDLQLATEASSVASSLSVQGLENPIFDFVVSGKPLSFGDVRKIVPDLTLYGNPRLELSLRGPLDKMEVHSTIELGDGRVDFDGVVNVKQEPYTYALRGDIRHLNLGELTGNDSLTSDLNLELTADGRGILPRQIYGEFTVNVDSSQFQSKRIRPSKVRAKLTGEKVDFEMNTRVEGALTYLTGHAVFGAEQFSYGIQGKVQNFNLSRFDLVGPVASSINFVLDLQGSGRTADDLQGVLKINFLPSNVSNVPVDSADFEFDYSGQNVTVRKFAVFSPFGELQAEGEASVRGRNRLQVRADLARLSFLSEVGNLDSLSGHGEITVLLSGLLDSLLIESDLSFTEIASGDYQIAKLVTSGEGLISDSTWFRISGSILGVQAKAGSIDTTNFTIDYADSSAVFELYLQDEHRYSVATTGGIYLKPHGTEVELQHLDVSVLDQQWVKSEEPTKLTIHDSHYQFSELRLLSAGQELALSGTIDPEGQSAFSAALTNLDVSRYSRYLAQDISLRGRLDVAADFRGSLTEPTVGVGLTLTDGQYLNVAFESFHGKFNVSPDSLNWKCSLAQTASDSLLETSGMLPILLSFSPFDFKLLADQQLLVKASTRGLDISFLQAFLKGFEGISGKLVTDIVLRNTLEDLRGVGPIRLINCEFGIPELGTRYKQANIVLLLDEKDLIFHQFDMRSGGGFVKLVEGRLSLAEQQLQDFNVKFRVRHFELINNKKMRARAVGTVAISGSVQTPEFSGDLLVDQARIFYEEFEEETTVVLTSRPFFVIPPDSQEVDSLGALRFQKNNNLQDAVFTETNFYKNLRGELALVVPRNVWLRSSDASIEVECDLEAVKSSPALELFGQCSTLRGFYELFGNRFQIQTGELVFDGGPKMNPELHIEATTVIADQGGSDTDDKPVKHEFKVVITGTLDFPEFQFTLDDQPAEQADVVSILIFGQPFSDLEIGQRNQINQDAGLDSKAKGLVTGQLLKQLSRKLGNEFGLDVIQIESGGSLKDSKVKVGKYVTPEVFVSVSQDFGAEGNQVVELEYEIPKKLWLFNLLLQATSDRQGDNGLDLIWKVEW